MSKKKLSMMRNVIALWVREEFSERELVNSIWKKIEEGVKEFEIKFVPNGESTYLCVEKGNDDSKTLFALFIEEREEGTYLIDITKLFNNARDAWFIANYEDVIASGMKEYFARVSGDVLDFQFLSRELEAVDSTDLREGTNMAEVVSEFLNILNMDVEKEKIGEKFKEGGSLFSLRNIETSVDYPKIIEVDGEKHLIDAKMTIGGKGEKIERNILINSVNEKEIRDVIKRLVGSGVVIEKGEILVPSESIQKLWWRPFSVGERI